MQNILRLIHAFLGLNAIAAGIPACIRVVSGRPSASWVSHFLKFSIAASAVGLVLSINHSSFIQSVSMLGVYVSAFAVLSYRRHALEESWTPVFVLVSMCALCLDAVAMIAHVFRFLAFSNVIGSSQQGRPFAVAIVATVLVFAFLSSVALKNIRREPGNPVMQKVAR